MAITIRRAINAALQYNNSGTTDYIMRDNVDGKKFLTEAPNPRILKNTELSALYFVVDPDDLPDNLSVSYQYRGVGGELIEEVLVDVETLVNVHNAIPVNVVGRDDVQTLCVQVLGLGEDVIENGDFSLGSGDTFTDWTKVTPDGSIIQATIENKLLYSTEFDNELWLKLEVTVDPNAIPGPTTGTADAIIPTATLDLHGVGQNGESNYVNGTPYTAYVIAKAGELSIIQLLFSTGQTAMSYANFDLVNGVTGAFSGISSEIIPLENDYYQCVFTYFSAINGQNDLIIAAVPDINSPRATLFTGNDEDKFYLYHAQIGPGYRVNPIIITEDTRAIQFNGYEDTRAPELINISSRSGLTQIVVSVGETYKISIKAKNGIYTPGDMTLLQIGNAANAAAYYSVPIGNDFESFVFTVTAVTDTTLRISNGLSNSSLIFDDVSVSLLADETSETRCYNIDSKCAQNEVQVQWLNKLGGGDTWVFTGFPILTKTVSRETGIEYPSLTNFVSPKRVYATRQNVSRETYQLSHRCKDQQTADWLRSELIDTKDVLILLDGVYYPVDVLENSVTIENTFNKDLDVRFSFRFAYDVNIQGR